ncbi:pyridoxal phosphate-dependent aminotransferase [Treponema sp.]
MNFDKVIDRSGTDSIKWADSRNQTGIPDILPLWVADMDFPPPQEVIAAIQNRAAHPIFGYARLPDTYIKLLSNWYADRYGAKVRPESFLPAPGIIPSLGIAIRSLTHTNAGILIMPPVYNPFFDIVRDNDRAMVLAPFKECGVDPWVLDISILEKAVHDALVEGIKVEAMILCSPHNPGGRVWSHEELSSILKFADKKQLLIIADEIHGDLVTGSIPFVSFAGFGDGVRRAARRVVVLSGPNKTFNIAGLHLSHFIVENPELRVKIERGLQAAGFHEPDIFALAAASAAYEYGKPWLDELLPYLRSNLEFVAHFFIKHKCGMRSSVPEGTYLAWVDAHNLINWKGLKSDRALVDLLALEGRVRLNPGSMYGPGGEGFVRLNVACPRATLEEGLYRIEKWSDR